MTASPDAISEPKNQRERKKKKNPEKGILQDYNKEQQILKKKYSVSKTD